MTNKIVMPSTHTSTFAINSLSSAYRSDIDGLRAIAVSAVIIFHAFPMYLTGGFVGVDIFFVISGYLISSIIYNELDTDSFSFAQFYSRRIKRIFPSLIVVLIACYVIGWYLLTPVEYKNLGTHMMGGAGFFSNFLLSGESGYFDDTSDTKPLLHLWSLGIEEQFYIVWPILLYTSRKIKLNLLILTIVLILSSFTLNITRVKTNKNQTFYSPTSRVWELLIGAQLTFVLKYMNNHQPNVVTRLNNSVNTWALCEMTKLKKDILFTVTSIVGALLVTLPMYFLTKNSIFPGWWAVAPTMGTALLILTGPTAWINRNILSSRFPVGLGLISYPVYLWHIPLLVFTRLYMGDQTSTFTLIPMIIVSIIAAWITYVFIEKPFRFGEFTQTKLTFLCMSMLFIWIVGYGTYLLNGLPYRFPPLVQNITNYASLYSSRDVLAHGPGRCFVNPRDNRIKLSACVDNLEKPASTAVLLWGDSHAAHLRPGIVAARSNLRITQLTASECAPIYGYSRPDIPNCKYISDYISKRILHEKPNTVILAACWSIYEKENLTETITYLRNATVKNIYLVGPVPFWQKSLSRTLFDYYLHDALHQIPTRMSPGLYSYLKRLDQQMETFATNMKIYYISPLKILCNADGCLTLIGENADTLTTFDNAHFTIAASTFVVSHFPKSLLHSES